MKKLIFEWDDNKDKSNLNQILKSMASPSMRHKPLFMMSMLFNFSIPIIPKMKIDISYLEQVLNLEPLLFVTAIEKKKPL